MKAHLKELFIALITVCCSLSMQAQEYAYQYGNVAARDIELKSYVDDPDAPALILHDIGTAEFVEADLASLRHKAGGFTDQVTADRRYGNEKTEYIVRFTRSKRIKIFTDEGLDQKKVKILLYRENGLTEGLALLRASTYDIMNNETKEWKLEPKDFVKKEIDKHWTSITFSCPKVKAGRVIEYQYVIESPFVDHLPEWTFQDRIPTLYSEYKTSMIPLYEYVYITQGIDKFDIQRTIEDKKKRSWGKPIKSYGKIMDEGFEFNDVHYSYGMINVPAFKDEAYLTSINDYLMKMNFQLARFNDPLGGSHEYLSTWPELSKKLEGDAQFGKYIKAARKAAKKKYDFDNDFKGTTDRERAEQIIQKLRKNFRWNGEFDKVSARSARDFVESRKGNSAEINLFLLACLQEAGIDASPVLLSTRNHGRFKTDHPFMHFFNNVVIRVNSDPAFLADATSRHLPADLLPTQCLNQKGLLVDSNSETWIPLVTDTLAHTIHDINIRPDIANNRAKVSVSISTLDYAAYDRKLRYDNDTSSIKSDICASLQDVRAIKTSNFDRTDRPYNIGFDGDLLFEQGQDTLRIDPFLGLAMKENLLKQKKRDYPVDLIYARSDEFRVRLEIPSGYQLVKMPESYAIDNSLASISMEAIEEDNTVNIVGRYAFKKAVYSPKEYQKIRAYMNKIVEYFGADVVLVSAGE